MEKVRTVIIWDLVRNLREGFYVSSQDFFALISFPFNQWQTESIITLICWYVNNRLKYVGHKKCFRKTKTNNSDETDRKEAFTSWHEGEKMFSCVTLVKNLTVFYVFKQIYAVHIEFLFHENL